ncbi:hypothetical protein ETD86_37015 [Nonomuraea turkmeniaca]|uniref:Uncharacterized protein n=1 Tax=Nonomuraea turkmeniaca TaxID=103838 RepID=A0A5S4F4Y2_9ACTN|nr:hypothetical protein [Nonomuraea turkmeniaca]TMR11049.1 hypothetical protein ETD86_37015 [Nonomuraea turkmeniaca]
MSDVLDDLAERMILPAARLVPAVQDLDESETQAILSSLSLLELRALAVVLASLVPADDPAMELFTTWMHQSKPVPPRPISEGEARANRRRLLEALDADPDPIEEPALLPVPDPTLTPDPKESDV